MSDILKELYDLVEKRKAAREEGSYTAYLFNSGLDKILKKLGEECAETIIAAKNLKAGRVVAEGAAEEEAAGSREALTNETGDLIYHLTVMLSELGVRPEEIENVLRARMKKTGNLKEQKQADNNT